MQRELLASKDGKVLEYVVGRAEIAALYGVSAMSVSRWCKAGLDEAAKVGRGKYDLGKVVRWQLDRITQEAKPQDPRYTTESLRLKTAQSRKAEIEADVLSGTLVHVDEVYELLTRSAAIYAAQLESLGHRHGMDLADISDPVRVRDILTETGREIRQATAGELTKEAKRLERRRTAG